MTNRQWLLEQMQNMSDEEIGDFISECVCKQIKCHDFCEYKYPYRPCKSCKLEWLKQEHKEKPKLSDAERVILENIDKEYMWIARDEDTGHLHIYIEKPIRVGKEKYWSVNMDDDYKTISFYDNLFKFIKGDDNKPYNIEELLKGE